MDKEAQRFWVLGDGQGHAGRVIGNGMHLIDMKPDYRRRVKVKRPDDARYRRILAIHWDALPKAPYTGQSFPEALAEVRKCSRSSK